MGYLHYTRDFGDYAQVCELSSVMVYDHEYRRKQAQLCSRWGIDDIHLTTFYLQKKRDARKPMDRGYRRMDRPPRLLDSSGVEICRNFNVNQCFRDNCRFSHVCSVCKDRGHTKAKHEVK